MARETWLMTRSSATLSTLSLNVVVTTWTFRATKPLGSVQCFSLTPSTGVQPIVGMCIQGVRSLASTMWILHQVPLRSSLRPTIPSRISSTTCGVWSLVSQTGILWWSAGTIPTLVCSWFGPHGYIMRFHPMIRMSHAAPLSLTYERWKYLSLSSYKLLQVWLYPDFPSGGVRWDYTVRTPPWVWIGNCLCWQTRSAGWLCA